MRITLVVAAVAMLGACGGEPETRGRFATVPGEDADSGSVSAARPQGPPDAQGQTDAAPVVDPVDAGAPNDARADVGTVVIDPVDAGEVGDGGAVVVDAGTTPDGSTSANPCVTSIDVPATPYWAVWVRYTLSPTTSRNVPYYCPTATEGVRCKAALYGGPTYYPPQGVCRVAVPDRCLPCTGGVTEW